MAVLLLGKHWGQFVITALESAGWMQTDDVKPLEGNNDLTLVPVKNELQFSNS